jgi:hypothetical protein
MGFSSGNYSTYHEGNGYEWSESHSARYSGGNALAILNNAGKENENEYANGRRKLDELDEQVRQLGLEIRKSLQSQGFEIKDYAISDQLIMEVLQERFPKLPSVRGWSDEEMYLSMERTFWLAFHRQR